MLDALDPTDERDELEIEEEDAFANGRGAVERAGGSWETATALTGLCLGAICDALGQVTVELALELNLRP